MVRWFWSTAVTAATAFLWSGTVAADEHAVTVRVEPRHERGAISPFIFGAGIDAKTNPLRSPADPDKVFRDIAESGLRFARYPGGFVFNRNHHRGSWANFYWQDHIGQNPEGHPTEVYDLDTFVQLCERFGIEPLMQINFVGESQESVQGYLEYLVGDGDVDGDGDGVDWAARRAANGREEPYRIRYWQLGNEVHSYEQGFHPNAAGAKEYAEALERLVPVIRKMVPDARIVVPFINIERPRSGMKLPGDEPDINFTTSGEFAYAFLSNLSVDVDYFDWHFYPANGWGGNWPFLGTDDEWKHYYCWGTKFRECYDVIDRMLTLECRQTPAPELIVGEWSGDWTAAIFPQYEQAFRGSMMRTMASAVFMADILLFMMDTSAPAGRIHAACWHTFCNDAQALFSIQTAREHGISYKGTCTDKGYGFRMPLYWVFKLLSEQRGERLVRSTLEGDDNRIAAPANGLYSDPEFSFERVVHCASRTDRDLYVALLNKDAHEAVTVTVELQDWTMEQGVQVFEVGADSYLAENTIAAPDTVRLTGPHPLQAESATALSYSLSPNTLAVLHLVEAAATNP
jgi:alpha-L-arabinofuranosidase